MNNSDGEVLRDSNEKLKELRKTHRALAKIRGGIKDNAYSQGRALTADEILLRMQVGAVRSIIGDAIQELTLKAIREFDKSNELNSIIKNITAINKDLSETIKKLDNYNELPDKLEEILVKLKNPLARG